MLGLTQLPNTAVVYVRTLKKLCSTQSTEGTLRRHPMPTTECKSPVYKNVMNIDRISIPNRTRLNTALTSAINNTHSKCEADK